MGSEEVYCFYTCENVDICGWPLKYILLILCDLYLLSVAPLLGLAIHLPTINQSWMLHAAISFFDSCPNNCESGDLLFMQCTEDLTQNDNNWSLQ